MTLDEIRPSFTVFVVSAGDSSELVETLDIAGYRTGSYLAIDAALNDVAHDPPHVVLLEVSDDLRDTVEEVITRVHDQLPESHVIVLAPSARRAELAGLLDSGAYDLLYLPLAAPVELLRAIDRAAERDYFMYLNERSEAVAAPEAPPPPPHPVAPPAARPAAFAREVFRCRGEDAAVELFLSRVGGGVYFRYVANRRVLLATAKAGVAVEIGGLGIDLNGRGPGAGGRALREPHALFVDLAREVFGTEDFFTRTLEVAGEVRGVFVFFDRAFESPSLDDHLLLLDRAVGLLEMERRLHVVDVRDDQTDVLARPHFLIRVTQEVARARRLNLPVSLLTLAFDQYDLVGTEVGPEEAQLMLRTIARLCERYSRVHDVIGRLGPSELGLILPHTGRRGALVKAERLRRALAQADFAKVVRTHPRVTVSIGVSEYPSLVRDAEDLVASADETLFHIRRRGNRVATAEPPRDFTPDFAVSDQGA